MNVAKETTSDKRKWWIMSLLMAPFLFILAVKIYYNFLSPLQVENDDAVTLKSSQDAIITTITPTTVGNVTKEAFSATTVAGKRHEL